MLHFLYHCWFVSLLVSSLCWFVLSTRDMARAGSYCKGFANYLLPDRIGCIMMLHYDGGLSQRERDKLWDNLCRNRPNATIYIGQMHFLQKSSPKNLPPEARVIYTHIKVRQLLTHKCALLLFNMSVSLVALPWMYIDSLHCFLFLRPLVYPYPVDCEAYAGIKLTKSGLCMYLEYFETLLFLLCTCYVHFSCLAIL